MLLTARSTSGAAPSPTITTSMRSYVCPSTEGIARSSSISVLVYVAMHTLTSGSGSSKARAY